MRGKLIEILRRISSKKLGEVVVEIITLPESEGMDQKARLRAATGWFISRKKDPWHVFLKIITETTSV